jgi:hypothetical protein
MSQSGGKATLKGEDGLTFEVQFNPKEFSVSKGLTWEESKEQGQDKNSVQFQKGAPMTASFDLYFDTTGNGGNVQSEWVNPLLALTKAEISPSTGEAKELSKKRPRWFNFTWGSFTMQCVIEQISVTYLMFSSDGTAVRARAQVKLKEWKPPDFAGSQGSFRWDTDKVSLIEVSGSPSINQVAAQNDMDWRDLAAANPGAGDLMSMEPGTTLVRR